MLLLLACLQSEPARPQGRSASPEDSGAPGDSERQPDLARGRSIHDNTCASGYCHDENDVLDQRVPELTDDQIFRVVRYGEGYMQPQDQLSDADIRDCIAYLRVRYR